MTAFDESRFFCLLLTTHFKHSPAPGVGCAGERFADLAKADCLGGTEGVDDFHRVALGPERVNGRLAKRLLDEQSIRFPLVVKPRLAKRLGGRLAEVHHLNDRQHDLRHRRDRG